MNVRVGIVGFRGYSGMELQKILARHPGVECHLLEHRDEAPAIPDASRQLELHAVFLATPRSVSRLSMSAGTLPPKRSMMAFEDSFIDSALFL